MSAATSHHPLIAHRSPEATIAWRNGAPISVSQFLSDVQQLATGLPAGRHILNVCNDRYHFAVGLAAALATGKVSLLPSTLAPEMVRQLQGIAPNLFYLTDNAESRFDLPCVAYPTAHARDTGRSQIPLIESERLVAQVFTSGSTGTPQPHAKHWGALVRNVQAGASLLGLLDGRAHTIIGTVPPQHMFGFESTVLLALLSGQALDASRPFYPADISSAIAAVPRPRLLVSTPFHLKSLLAADEPIPPVDLIVSATAPLSLELAQQAERRLQAPLQEIYGSTETGQIATRRPVAGPEWQLFPGVELREEGEQIWARGAHVEQPVAMSDLIELSGPHRFLLHGRTADLINIAGKRSSLAYLNHQLTTIPGIIDGSFFMPDEETPDSVTRLVAVVVAPTLTARTLRQTLRSRIDPAFMPRPLLFVEALPRSANGKLPREALKELIRAHTPARTPDLEN